ncbi:MAG TPA: 3-deoxy-manno-octulosonate cytidylyltransferase [Bacteroidales bacterium]|nr:3-deoxy-manno-octulosonate cytidylyltransferase [Bacteroidales bacterium]HRZ48581.1 3-deoxy-manno-octulosonate cytidylyltransferase [Bacteroidales bacterium]
MKEPLRILGIIPARFASTRFPGKPLADILGKSMIERVYTQATKASALSEVVVATDDKRIFTHVQSFGGKGVMTSHDHMTGTDRCHEVITQLPWSAFDVIVNIQGDEPLIDPEQIDLLASLFQDPQVKIGTLIRPLSNPEHLDNPNVVKVTRGLNHRAAWFSRSPIPFIRNYPKNEWLNHHQFYEHIGMYGFTRDALTRVAALGPSMNETAESLEQLRWLDHGFAIHIAISNHLSCSVDTPEDLEKVTSILNR